MHKDNHEDKLFNFLDDDIIDDYDETYLDDDLEELLGPPSSDEENLAKIRKLMEEAKKLEKEKQQIKEENKKLIEQEVDYDEKTMMIFEEFADNLTYLYPGILKKEEIIDRLKANIKHNIIFKDLGYEPKSKYNKAGFFNALDHLVVISNNERYDSESIRSSIFHELCHALVESNPYDDEDEHQDYEKRNFITESIVTIMEEDYNKKILNRNFNRVNGYIPNYARCLRAVFGDELIKEYVRRFKHIDGLIADAEIDNDFYISNMAFDLIAKIDSVYYKLQDESIDINVSYENSNIELGFSKLLWSYLKSNKDISDEEKIKKIESMIAIQLTPNFSVFKEMIEDTINNKDLIKKYPMIDFVYRANLSDYESLYGECIIDLNSDDLSKKDYIYDNKLLSKYKDYAYREMFDVNEYGYEHDKYESIPSYNYEKVLLYNNNQKLYRLLYDFYVSGELSEDDIDIISISSNGTSDKYDSRIINMIKKGFDPESPEVKLTKLIYGLSNEEESIFRISTKKGDYFVVDGDDLQLLRKTTIDDYVISLDEKRKNGKESEETVRVIFNNLKELKDRGITEVYTTYDKYLFIENDNIYKSTILVDEDIDTYETKTSIDTDKVDLKEIKYLKANKLKVQKNKNI